MAKLVNRPDVTFAEQAYVPEIVKGLSVTMRRFFKNTFTEDNEIDTIYYPEEKRVYPERFRGIHRLTHRIDGSPRCVACLCCSTACPAQCIHIEPAAYPEDDPRRGYERYPARFVIDELRCIFCGMCEEACPVDAIELTPEYDLVGRTRDEMVFDKEKLLNVFDKTVDAKPRKNPRITGYAGTGDRNESPSNSAGEDK